MFLSFFFDVNNDLPPKWSIKNWRTLDYKNFKQKGKTITKNLDSRWPKKPGFDALSWDLFSDPLRMLLALNDKAGCEPWRSFCFVSFSNLWNQTPEAGRGTQRNSHGKLNVTAVLVSTLHSVVLRSALLLYIFWCSLRVLLAQRHYMLHAIRASYVQYIINFSLHLPKTTHLTRFFCTADYTLNTKIIPLVDIQERYRTLILLSHTEILFTIFILNTVCFRTLHPTVIYYHNAVCKEDRYSHRIYIYKLYAFTHYLLPMIHYDTTAHQKD